MARVSLTALRALDRAAAQRLWMTTRDAARLLDLSRFGVWWLTRNGDLRGERTVSGQWLFRKDVVVALRDARAEARLRRRPAVLRAAHLRLVQRPAPRQLELFTARGGVVPAAERAAMGRKLTQHSLSETWRVGRETGVGPIRPTLLTSEGRKRMAKAEGDGRNERGASVDRRHRA
jgi:hypothetical protein